jgi:hypothetical protein
LTSTERRDHYDLRMPVRAWSLFAASAALALTACSGSDSPADAAADRGTETTPVSGTATDEANGGCADEVTNKAATAGHEKNGTEMNYEVVPPVSGLHWEQWDDLTQQVYEVDERPELGKLVHSQEHGWTIVWYAESLADDDAAMAELQAASDTVNDAGAVKVVFVPWTEDDGDAFPDDATIAMTHWTGSANGDELEVRQFCTTINADAVLAFSERNPYTNSREPNAP